MNAVKVILLDYYSLRAQWFIFVECIAAIVLFAGEVVFEASPAKHFLIVANAYENLKLICNEKFKQEKTVRNNFLINEIF